jgi:hypothetical protein
VKNWGPEAMRMIVIGKPRLGPEPPKIVVGLDKKLKRGNSILQIFGLFGCKDCHFIK